MKLLSVFCFFIVGALLVVLLSPAISFATWTSLAPDFSGVQADTLTVVSSMLSVLVIVVGLGILIRVMLH